MRLVATLVVAATTGDNGDRSSESERNDEQCGDRA